MENVKPNFKTDGWCCGATILELFLQQDLWNVLTIVVMEDFPKNEELTKPHALAEVKHQALEIYRGVKEELVYDPRNVKTQDHF